MTEKTPPIRSTVSRVERMARLLVPFAVSAALLFYLFRRIDLRVALDYLTLEVVLRFSIPLLIFLVVTLLIDAQCLHRVAHANPAETTPLRRMTAARIKAACYLLGLLNYALGAAGLSVLLQRRSGASLASAAGMVFLISLLDIGSVLLWVAGGATLLQTDAFGLRIGLRIGLVSGLILAIVAGFIFLRAPMSMGLLEPLRNLEIFRAPRTAPAPLLIEIGILRFLFVGCFVALTGALFWAFEIDVGITRLAMNVGIMLVVSALPIAAGGLGTGQVVFVELFSGLAPDAELLSASIVFSIGLIATRALIGISLAPEFTREAFVATRVPGGPEEPRRDESSAE